jgi:hypothetical protein
LMPRKLSTLHLLFSNLGARFLNEIFLFLYCSVQKLSLTVWPYPMPGACWTVPAVPDLLALPL